MFYEIECKITFFVAIMSCKVFKVVPFCVCVFYTLFGMEFIFRRVSSFLILASQTVQTPGQTSTFSAFL